MSFMRRWHPTIFPLVLALLTLLLVAFMIAAFAPRSAPRTAEEKVVSASEYREQMKEALAPMTTGYEGAKDDLARLVLVENALNAVLTLRVPASEKDVHLSVAFILNRLREGLREDSSERTETEKQWEKLLTENPWLK